MDIGILSGFANAMSPNNLLFAFVGSFLGTLIGVLPGLGPASTLAMLLPLTLQLPPEAGISMLMAVYYGSQYGGSTTAILLNVPGEISSAATCIDGYALAKQGRGASALSVVAVGSFIAAVVSIALISQLAPLLANVSLLFGPPEYFFLIAMSLVVVIALSRSSIVDGAIAAIVGLLLTTVGLDPLDGVQRFTFGNAALMSGFDLVPVLVGLFGVGEVLASMERELKAIYAGKPGGIFFRPALGDLRASMGAILRGSGLGFVFGIIPGVGPAVTTWLSYDLERRISPTPERFGIGAIQGVAGPESANNATAIAGMAPLMAFGIPTVPSLGIILAALQIYGLQPGPLLFTQNAVFTWTIIAAMFVGNLFCLILNLPLVGLWARLVSVPYRVLGPVILGACLISAYTARNSMFDVWIVVAFGVVGWVWRKVGMPIAPFILGIVLGPTLESSLRQSFSMSNGDMLIILSRPLALGILVVGVLIVCAGLATREKSAAVEESDE